MLKMKRVFVLKKAAIAIFFVFSVIFMNIGNGISQDKNELPSLNSLLPEPSPWKLEEEPENYFPETLYEYINGASEIYLNYDFRSLIVAQYVRPDSPASIAVEIYDMRNERNAFGIYSVERFPESTFITLGNGGYVEEGVLNFIVGTYYIKLICFDCEKGSDEYLKLFAQEIVNRVKDKRAVPELLRVFPREGMVENSEKFVLRNFLGYSFFHDGYLTQYKIDGLEFDCFLVEAKDSEDVQQMLSKYFEHHSQPNKDIKSSSVYHFKDKYYKNIFLSVVKNYICGVQRIKDGAEEIGQKYLKILMDVLLNTKF